LKGIDERIQFINSELASRLNGLSEKTALLINNSNNFDQGMKRN